MLRPANVVDLPILRALIREGALTGSFDRSLATESRESTLFFNNLRQALASGYFVEPDPRTGDLATVAVLAFVYLPDEDPTMHRPIGFGLFKAASIGYELWLTGIDAAWRGRGHGRRMLAELLDTRPGREAYLVRVTHLWQGEPGDGALAGCVRLQLRPRNAAAHVVPAQRRSRSASCVARADPAASRKAG